MFDKLIDLVIDSIKLFRVFVVIPEFEKGVILRFGKYRAVKDPGIAWIIPLGVDEVYSSPAYIQTMTIGPQSLVTKDGREIVVSTLVTHYVDKHDVHLLSVQGGEQAIEDTAYGVVAKFVMEQTWQELTGDDTSTRLTNKMRLSVDDYGVKVKKAQIIDLTKSRSLRLIQHVGNKLAVAAKE